jgi:probable phosphoglycerate mutase
MLRSSGVRVVLHELLREVDLPLWEGLAYGQVRSNFSHEYLTWRDHPDLLRMGRTRPVTDLYRRAERFWSEIRPPWVGKRLLIVSHLGTCRALIGTALGISAQFYHRTQHSNGGLSVLEFDGVAGDKPGSCRVQALNLTGHLQQVLPKLKEGKRGVRLLLLPSDGPAPPPPRLLDEWKADFVTSAEALNRENFYTVDGTVRTGIVIAPVPSLLSILMTTLGARRRDGRRWAMRHGHISVLHYPKPDGAGLLQVFNSSLSMHTGERSAS